jgi:ribosomal protein S18 acetylase RimI-like enzyme
LSEVSYRAAGAADAPALRGLLQALADHDGAGKVGSAEALVRHGFGARPLFHAILAERDREVVGMVLFYADFSTLRGQPGVYVQDFYVVESCRGLGIGRALLVRALRAAQEWGAAYLTLGVDPGNVAARRIYDGLGFRPRGYEFLILDGARLEALRSS